MHTNNVYISIILLWLLWINPYKTVSIGHLHFGQRLRVNLILSVDNSIQTQDIGP